MNGLCSASVRLTPCYSELTMSLSTVAFHQWSESLELVLWQSISLHKAVWGSWLMCHLLFTQALIRHSLGGTAGERETQTAVMFTQDFCVGVCIVFTGLSGLTLLHLCVWCRVDVNCVCGRYTACELRQLDIILCATYCSFNALVTFRMHLFFPVLLYNNSVAPAAAVTLGRLIKTTSPVTGQTTCEMDGATNVLQLHKIQLDCLCLSVLWSTTKSISGPVWYLL